MDYKEKYEKALENARNGKPLEEIFPELAESEDEKTKRMLNTITYKMSQHQPDIFTGEENEWLDSWLKSLKPQSHWKPSKEQMGTLKQWLENHKYDSNARYLYPIFNSLYEDLKKL